MDYRIRRAKSELASNSFVAITAGKHERASVDEARVALNVATWFGAGFDAELTHQRADVIALLRGLADGCDDFYSRGEWICVRGL